MAKLFDTEVSGIKCQLTRIPLQKMLLLDRKVMGILGPVMGSFAGMDQSAEADMEKIFRNVASALGSLGDTEYEALMNDLLGTVVATAPGKPPLQLIGNNLDTALGDSGMMTIYKIVMEVLKFNKFLPFDLGSLASLIGTGTPAIPG